MDEKELNSVAATLAAAVINKLDKEDCKEGATFSLVKFESLAARIFLHIKDELRR